MKYFLLVPMFSVIWGGVLAAEDALPSWANYGILGLILIAIIVTRLIVPGWIYTELKLENTELKAENKRLVQIIIDNQALTAPALAKSSEVIDKAMIELHRRGVT